jgi:hypothetical protein
LTRRLRTGQDHGVSPTETGHFQTAELPENPERFNIWPVHWISEPMSSEFRLQVATDRDRDDVVVELLYREDVVASIQEIEGEGLRIRVYSPPTQAWDLS